MINSMELPASFDPKRKFVGVLGLGFVGAAMSLAVASAGDNKNERLYNVIGVDLPTEAGQARAAKLNEGIFPFESNDSDLVSAMVKAHEFGNLFAVTDNRYLALADILIIDINLDINYRNDGEPYLDLSDFNNAMHIVGSKIGGETLIIVETTVPPGTCENIVAPIITEEFEKRSIERIPRIAHSYERVMPGKDYFNSIINYWRVYSGIDDESAKLCEAFLRTVIRTDAFPLTRLGSTTASETAKVLENSYRAVNIAFIEEWGRFAENVGIDLFEVINAIRMRPTHSNIRQPGFGVGGYCLTKDPYFAQLAAENIFKLPALKFPFCTQAIKINNKMPLVTLRALEKHLGMLRDKNILLMGISYREDVSDTRYSPSEIFARQAIKDGAIMTYHDPLVHCWEELDTMVLQDLPDPKDFDAIVFAVKHKEYTNIDFNKWLKDSESLVFDANNVLAGTQIADIMASKCAFGSIGRGKYYGKESKS